MASQVLMTISRDEVERARLISEEKYILDTQSKLTYAKQQGLRKGRAEGLAEGMEKGIEKGMEKGQTEKALEIARKLKDMGDSVERIHAITGLSPEAIEKL